MLEPARLGVLPVEERPEDPHEKCTHSVPGVAEAGERMAEAGGMAVTVVLHLREGEEECAEELGGRGGGWGGGEHEVDDGSDGLGWDGAEVAIEGGDRKSVV